MRVDPLEGHPQVERQSHRQVGQSKATVDRGWLACRAADDLFPSPILQNQIANAPPSCPIQSDLSREANVSLKLEGLWRYARRYALRNDAASAQGNFTAPRPAPPQRRGRSQYGNPVPEGDAAFAFSANGGRREARRHCPDDFRDATIFARRETADEHRVRFNSTPRCNGRTLTQCLMCIPPMVFRLAR